MNAAESRDLSKKYPRLQRSVSFGGKEPRTLKKLTRLVPPVVEDALLDDVLADLGFSGSCRAADIKHKLRSHAEGFAMGRYLQGVSPTVHEDVHRARKMAAMVAEFRIEADRYGVEVRALMAWRYSELTGQADAWRAMMENLEALEALLAKFGSARFGKKRSDEGLGNAVGGLMYYLETLTGHRATARRGNSSLDLEPILNTPEARTIAKLLRTVEPTLPDPTVIYWIDKNRRAYPGKKLSAKFGYVEFYGGTIRPF